MSTPRILATTQDKMLPKAVHTIFESNVLFSRLIGSAKKWSGETMKKTIKVSKNTTGGSFDGYDALDTNASDTKRQLSFDPKFAYKTVSLPLTDVTINKVNETQVINLLEIEVEEAAQDFADDLGTMIYGDGTGNGGKDLNGLGNIVDDGTVAATYGGLSRATYTSLKSTVTDSGGTLTLDKMAALWGAITDGTQKPTLGVATQTVFDLYSKLIEPKMRIEVDVPMFNNGQKGIAGFTGLRFKDFPIIVDGKAPDGTLFMLNEKELEFRALTMAMTQPVKYSTQLDGNDPVTLGQGFSFDKWLKPVNQAALIGHIYFGGQLASWNPKRHGKLTGITSA